MKAFVRTIVLVVMSYGNLGSAYAEGLPSRINISDFTVAGIAIDMPVQSATKKLGKPQSVTTEVLNQKTWKFAGLEINSEDDKVFSIIITSDKYPTSRGLRTGDSIERLSRLYGKPSSKEESNWTYKTRKLDDPMFSVHMEGDKVKQIYVGYYRGPGLD